MKWMQKATAITLCMTVCHFCVITVYAREIGAGGAQDFSLGDLSARKGIWSSRPAHPGAVMGSAGHVAWKSLPGPSPYWTCRTAAGAAVSLDVKGNGTISILEDSSIDLQAAGDELQVSVLRGSIQLEGPAGARVVVRTFDGTYLLGESAFKSRFSWRAGALSLNGDAGRRLSDSSEIAVKILPESDRIRLVNGRPGKLGVRVVDALGEPVQGARVEFSARDRGARISFAGSEVASVMTDEDGVAATQATAFSGGAPAAVTASVAGTAASAAVQADVDRTTGGQKMMAWIVLGALAAASVILVILIKDEDDPELSTGAPSRIAP
jgi:hypothetical protein